jgi:hypothetical protein
MKNINFNKYLTQQSFNEAIINDNFINLTNEIIVTLEELALNGFLKPIVFSDTHYTSFSYSWNKFINQEISHTYDEDNLMQDINYFIQKLIIFNTNRHMKDTPTEESSQELFNKFIDFLNLGKFDTYCTPENQCFNCGSTLHIKFNNWEPTFFEFKKILEPENYRTVISETSPLSFLNKQDYFPASECFEDFVQIKDFEFKTGNLIITDWIRLDEFTKAVEPNSNIYHFDINNSKGRHSAFEHYLNQEFISINSYSGLDLYSLKEDGMEDCLFFGKIDYNKNETEELNKKQFKFERRLNRGLRATTIIEKETLIDIVNQQINDLNKAKQLVDDYLKKNQDEIISRQITPGIYSLIFDLRFKNVDDLLFPQNITEDFDSTIFLYPKKLTPNHTRRPKKIKP